MKNNELPTRISAGGVVLRKEQGKWTIALEQQKDYMNGSWFLPKGHVEEGEDLEGTARREISEEVGVHELTLVEYLGKKERITEIRKEHKIIHYFLFETSQLELTPTATDKAHRGKWFDLFDEAVITPYDEQNEVLEMVRKKLSAGN